MGRGEGVRREHRRFPRARRAGAAAKIAKQSRGGKIFVDYLRNAETASAVAAYSPRARPGAHVTPLGWDELDSTDIRGAFTVLNIAQRLRSIKVDPWAGYDSVRQRITDSMRNALR